MSEAITEIFTWHSLSDACPKCRNLNGREWYNPEEKGWLHGDILWDWVLAQNVWDLNSGSVVHPHCRCQLTVRFEINPEKLLPALKKSLLEIKQKLMEMTGK